MKVRSALVVLTAGFTLALGTGCKTEPAAETQEVVKTPGVDVDKKIIHIGTLDDQTGPAAAIGKPFAAGKQILAARINAGGTGLLPDGWTVQLHQRDHGYNPQKAVQSYNEIKDDILFIGTSFGTPNTLPLRPMLERDEIVAFPASLSSKMSEHEYTSPIGPSYKVEAMRAMDWVVEQAGGSDEVKAAIIYQQDDYGADGLDGWTAAAKHHHVEIVSQQTIAPGQKDFAAVITGLKEAGATHVLLTTLPSATGPILGTAAQLEYMPVWVGNTPSWVDRFFDPKVIPAPVFANFYWMNGLPYWGEDVPGMKDFLAAYEKFGKGLTPPDFYALVSYIQGLAQIEAAKRAIAANTINREGFLTQLKTLKGYTAGGMVQPLDLSKFPYEAGINTRVLKPDMEKKSWTVVANYAPPTAYTAKPEVAGGGESE
jgi:ABC-type branched-subunit amino acid transport system substrate-binding protein